MNFKQLNFPIFYMFFFIMILVFILNLHKLFIDTTYLAYRKTQVEGIANKLEKFAINTGTINTDVMYKAFRLSKLNGDKIKVELNFVDNLKEARDKLEVQQYNNDAELIDKNYGTGVIIIRKEGHSGENSTNMFTYGDPINFIVYSKTKLPTSNRVALVTSKRSIVVKGRTDTNTGNDYEYGYSGDN